MLDQARQTVEKLSEPDDEGSAAPFEDDAAER
jgi:exonuclease VII small subunit